ncbi:hypothetical protein [Bdellovibrio sp. HCB274]|uniref:hypothetical protein n=1 Tax=Bdellovibrio sp. HCB274 TaxID=3394361 RepID=UPI0039B604E1
MKVLKVAAKYTAIFIAVSIVTTLTAVGGVTYYVLNNLHEEQKQNHNLQEVMKIGEGYVLELESFNSLKQILENKNMPPFCKTLCNPSELDQDQLINERTAYLTTFYKTAGNRALKDPRFRFKLWQMSVASKVVPDSVRDLLKDILNKDTLSNKNKVLLTLQVESTLLTQLPTISQRLESFKAENDRLELARSWIKACQNGANAKKIISDCEAEFSSAN